MGIIDDIIKALDRIPIWKRLQDVPNEIDNLKLRISDLEEKLGGRWPPDVCRYCGARASRLTATLGPDDKGKMHEHWSCNECQKTEKRIV